jgi:acyl-coenzyme A thioesterase PaaI-like protein
MNDLTNKVFKTLGGQSGVTIPPPAIKGLEPTFLEHIPNESFKVSFPIKESYNNPFGITFGGYFGMFFDAAFGPFSGMTAQQGTTSLDLNVTFLKPLAPKDKNVIVEAKLVSKSKSYLLIEGKAYSEGGVLVATATSRFLILNKK